MKVLQQIVLLVSILVIVGVGAVLWLDAQSSDYPSVPSLQQTVSQDFLVLDAAVAKDPSESDNVATPVVEDGVMVLTDWTYTRRRRPSRCI